MTLTGLPKIVAFTPAGRQRYMQLLVPYIANDPIVSEWYVLDNCRDDKDRQWLYHHVATLPKVRIFKKADDIDRLKAINAFYRELNEPETFYIKLDDDIVWMQPGFFESFIKTVLAVPDKYTWYSPLIINNAICNWLVKHRSQIHYPDQLFCMSACPVSWYDPNFAVFVHDLFLKLLAAQKTELYHVPNQPIMTARYSINCIGFWGRERLAFGDSFAPNDICDEEWISAVWPVLTGRPGMIIGNVLASHFSFFPQEKHLLATDILDRYYCQQNRELQPQLLATARADLPERISPF